MNYKMKNELQTRTEKALMVEEEIMPCMTALYFENVDNKGGVQQIEGMIKNIDKFEQNQKTIDSKLLAIKNHNQELKEGIPNLDA